MVGTGRGAQAGVLVRNAQALQALESVDTLVVDKTGTLTQGRFAVAALEAVPGLDERGLLALAAAVEKGSEHPLAAAILARAHELGVAVPDAQSFEALPGRGVQAVVQGKRVRVGNADHASEGALSARAEELRAQGQTVVAVSIDGAPAGLLGLSDPPRPEAADAVRELRAQGLRVLMLTGDRRATAEVIAKRLGIEEVIAEVLPAQKAEAVRRLQAEGRKVAMAGDGINDAPALAAADVGIAMGTGTDVALESASITLLLGDLRGLLRARRLARATLRNIRQNLAFALGYNALGVPIAAGALYPALGWLLSPMIASAAMTFSSVSVIANALRLHRARL
jgi:Cu+-exporting ATPase